MKKIIAVKIIDKNVYGKFYAELNSAFIKNINDVNIMTISDNQYYNDDYLQLHFDSFLDELDDANIASNIDIKKFTMAKYQNVTDFKYNNKTFVRFMD